MTPFNDGLADGQRSEKLLMETLCSTYNVLRYKLAPEKEQFQPWDLKLEIISKKGLRAITTIEVKRDCWKEKSPRIPITVFKEGVQENEYSSIQLPSNPAIKPNFGIYRTCAEWYAVHSVKDRAFYIASVCVLRSLLEQNRYYYHRSLSNDFDKPVPMGSVMVPKHLYEEDQGFKVIRHT